jgi:glyoxylase-like metal-dependent hydrolase (beta-lactamase superfamily II)
VKIRKIGITLVLLSLTFLANATLKVQKISQNIYALEGEITQRSEKNFGNNSTHGVIITQDGVILIDSGASYLGAHEIAQTIQSLTDKTVKIVINTGGQDHRWLGNDYFKQRGARIIASKKTRQDQIDRTDYHLNRLGSLIGKSLNGTYPVYADEVFDAQKNLNFGGMALKLYYAGSAHTVGDIFVHLPSENIIFSGDIVFNDRMLGVGPARDIKSWIQVFEKMASLNPSIIVPGHGKVSDLATASKNTYQYLLFLQQAIAEVLEEDGDLLQASKIDQSKYFYLKNHASIAGKNAQWVFEKMEFDE